MGRRQDSPEAEWVEEAARLICDEGYTDYRVAKAKAGERLGIPARGRAPDNAAIEAAVIARQQLFGGTAYVQRLAAMRRTALQAMKVLAPFSPRLAGATVTGAIGDAHRVQLHVFSDAAEAVEIHLIDRHIEVEQDERRYRFSDGREDDVPLCRFEADDVGVDVAVFAFGAERNPPLSAVDGRPAKRLTAEQVRGLLDAPR